MPKAPDTNWNDDEIIFKKMSPDTAFIFDRMTEATLQAASARPGEFILDVACGRAKDALEMARRGAELFGLEASNLMIQRAFELLGEERDKVRLVRGLAENLPFPDRLFDKVVCKGAMDHFADIEKSLAEMARVTRGHGVIIIAVANFESLTSRMGKALSRLREQLLHTPPPDHPFWEPPADHNFKFDLHLLLRIISPRADILSITGISLLWGFPKWGALLEKMPPALAGLILRGLDRIARRLPSLADVIIATASPK